MGRDELKQFVLNNYRINVNGRLGVEKIREQAVRLIDQFGMA